jgi:signal transduction histidine kinase
VNRALTALEKASGLLQSAMRDRDRSLETEREARAAAETANAAKDEFLAMLGHELRNPVAAISSAATIVRSRKGTPEQFDFAAGVIERQVTHVKRLIDDLLDVGRVMTGKILLEQRPLDLAASTRGIVATLQTARRLADREVDVDATAVWVLADHTRIEQILTNVLVNAVSYTSPGGRIRVRERDQTILIVEDNADARESLSVALTRRVPGHWLFVLKLLLAHLLELLELTIVRAIELVDIAIAKRPAARS